MEAARVTAMRHHAIHLAVLLAIPLCAAEPARPNFVLILGEGHGWSSTSVKMDEAVAESKSTFVRTPNLERLAREGMRFAHFYASSPRCTPSGEGKRRAKP